MRTITIIKKFKQKIDSIAEFIYYNGFAIFEVYNNVHSNSSHLNPEYVPSTLAQSWKKIKSFLNDVTNIMTSTNRRLNCRGEGAMNGYDGS